MERAKSKKAAGSKNFMIVSIDLVFVVVDEVVGWRLEILWWYQWRFCGENFEDSIRTPRIL